MSFRDPLLHKIACDLGLAPEAQSIYGIGLRNSGNQVRLIATGPGSDRPVDVLKGVGPGKQEVENLGIACVHVAVRDANDRSPFGTAPNQRILLKVDWATGRAGGSAFVDATQGARFSMNGALVVNVQASFVSNALDASGIPVAQQFGNDKLIEGSIQWGSDTFQPAYYPVGTIPLAANADSVALPIPAQARRVTVYTDTAAVSTTLKLCPAGGGAPIYSSLFTRDNSAGASTPIVAGAETFILNATGICKALAVFELWL